MLSVSWLSEYGQQVELLSSHCDLQTFKKLQLQRDHLGDHLQAPDLQLGKYNNNINFF